MKPGARFTKIKPLFEFTDGMVDPPRHTLILERLDNRVRVAIIQDATQRGKFVDLSASSALSTALKLFRLSFLALFGRS